MTPIRCNVRACSVVTVLFPSSTRAVAASAALSALDWRTLAPRIWDLASDLAASDGFRRLQPPACPVGSDLSRFETPDEYSFKATSSLSKISLFIQSHRIPGLTMTRKQLRLSVPLTDRNTVTDDMATGKRQGFLADWRNDVTAAGFEFVGTWCVACACVCQTSAHFRCLAVYS